ncbi:hypothetical protein A3759_07075 [Thalassolituus sp. HI0120]|nr:hypothetical protein A3759_07075 [Thalassolituus sp. HI0120]
MSFNWSKITSDILKLTNARVSSSIDLSAISRWKIGGIAPLVVHPHSEECISAVIQYCNDHSVPFLVIGDTSNLLFDDAGVNALIIKIGNEMSYKQVIGRCIHVQAGAWVPSLARFSAAKGLAGLEHTAGIPGRLGGLICMNGGSQRKGIGDNLLSVRAVLPSGEVVEYDRDSCGFSYRNSIFLSNKAIITSAVIELDTGDTQSIRRAMLEILKSRRLKFPLKQPNCGSVFASNPAMYKEIGPPGFAIEKLGLKGFSIGGAKISEHHANFFVNDGQAKSSDMCALISYVQECIKNSTGYYMKAEVRYVSEDGNTTVLGLM